MASEKELAGTDETQDWLDPVTVRDLRTDCLYDFEKKLKQEHIRQTTHYLQFCPSDNEGAQACLVGTDAEADGNRFLKMAAAADEYLARITSGMEENSQHVMAYGAGKHPAFASILTRECQRFKVSLTLVYTGEDGRLNELQML